MDGGLFEVLQAQLKFGTLLHKLALTPYPSDQTVKDDDEMVRFNSDRNGHGWFQFPHSINKSISGAMTAVANPVTTVNK